MAYNPYIETALENIHKEVIVTTTPFDITDETHIYYNGTVDGVVNLPLISDTDRPLLIKNISTKKLTIVPNSLDVSAKIDGSDNITITKKNIAYNINPAIDTWFIS